MSLETLNLVHTRLHAYFCAPRKAKFGNGSLIYIERLKLIEENFKAMQKAAHAGGLFLVTQQKKIPPPERKEQSCNILFFVIFKPHEPKSTQEDAMHHFAKAVPIAFHNDHLAYPKKWRCISEFGGIRYEHGP